MCPDREAKLIKDKESDVEMFQKEEQKMNEDDPEYDAAGTDGKWTRLSRVAVAPEATEDGGGGTMEILSTMELQTLLQKYQVLRIRISTSELPQFLCVYSMMKIDGMRKGSRAAWSTETAAGCINICFKCV